MSPQKRGVIPPDHQSRIVEAMRSRDEAEAELRAAVTGALLADGSVREVAALTGLSTNTVQRWGREGGWPSAKQKAERAAIRAKNAAYRAAGEQALRDLENRDA